MNSYKNLVGPQSQLAKIYYKTKLKLRIYTNRIKIYLMILVTLQVLSLPFWRQGKESVDEVGGHNS